MDGDAYLREPPSQSSPETCFASLSVHNQIPLCEAFQDISRLLLAKNVPYYDARNFAICQLPHGLPCLHIQAKTVFRFPRRPVAPETG